MPENVIIIQFRKKILRSYDIWAGFLIGFEATIEGLAAEVFLK
jgi:hypothetical protein